MKTVTIKLITIKRQLQQKMHYPMSSEGQDPWDEYLTLDEAFEELLRGFRLYAQRKGLYSFASISAATERGYMTEQMADLFTDYCIKGWRVV